MGKLLTTEDPAPVNETFQGTGYPSMSEGLGLGAAAEDAWYNNPVASMTRGADLSIQERGTQISRWGGFRPPTTPLLEPKDANDRFGIEGQLSFKEPVREGAAKLQREWALERMEIADKLQRADQGIGAKSARLGTELLVSAADPINLASAFIPVVGEARYAAMAARFGRPLARIITGAAEGIVGQAAVEPFIYSQAKREQQDYDAYDTLTNLAMGAGIGAVAHTVLGPLLDRGRSAGKPAPTANQHIAALRAALAAVAEDRPVTSAELLDAISGFQARDLVAKEAGSSPTARSSASEAGGDFMKASPRPEGTQVLDEGTQASINRPPEGSGSENLNMVPSQDRGAARLAGNGVDMNLSSTPKIYQGENDVNALRQHAALNLPEVESFGRSLTDGVEGAEFYGARAKEAQAIESKVAGGKEPNQISDYLGARIVIESWDALKGIMDRLKASGRVLAVDDLMRAPKDGYRAVHVQVKAADGRHSFELQIQPKEINDVVRDAHTIYEKWRRKPTSEFTEDDIATQRIDMDQMRGILDGAWARWLKEQGPPPENLAAAGSAAKYQTAADAIRRSHEPTQEEKSAVAAAVPMEKRMLEPESLDAAEKEAKDLETEANQDVAQARAGGLLTEADEAALEAGNTDAKISQARAKGIRAFGACLLGARD